MPGPQYNYQRYLRYLQSSEWKYKEKTLFDWVNWKCELCSKPTRALIAHHIHYNELYDESFESLWALCYDCHQGVHRLLDSEGKLKPKDLLLFEIKLLKARRKGNLTEEKEAYFRDCWAKKKAREASGKTN